MIGEIRIPRCRFAATFGQASSQAERPMEVAPFMAEGDYTAWFRSLSIGRFTTTTQVRGGRSIDAEKERFYQMMRDAAHRAYPPTDKKYHQFQEFQHWRAQQERARSARPSSPDQVQCIFMFFQSFVV